MTKAIIFDMDGVIIDSEKYWTGIERKYAKMKGLDYNYEYRKIIAGRSEEDMAKILKERFGDEEYKEEILEERNKTAQEIYDKKASLIPGFLELIKRIKNSGKYKVGLATSSPWHWVNPIFRRFDIKKYFEVVISADDIGGKGKPAPDIYLFTAKRLDVNPEECVVIEDTVNGIKSAKAAGMRCIALESDYTNNGDLKKVGADLIVRSLKKIDLERITLP